MDDEKTPSIGISYQVQTRASRQLVLQAFVDRDCEVATLNALLDKLRDAAERQYVREKIDDIRMEIKRAEHKAIQQQIGIEKADAEIKRNWEKGSRRGDPRLTQQEIQKQQQAYESAESIKHELAVLNEDLAKFEVIVG
jgi:hypothetical protein